MWRADAAEDEARALCARWGVEPVGAPVISAHGCVWAVRRGQDLLMLKLVAPDDEEVRGAEMLALWGGRGAVRLERAEDGPILMEHVAPGGPDLAAMVGRGEDAAATAILCDVALELGRVAPAAAPGWRDMGDRRDDILRDLADGPPLARPDRAIFAAALAVAARRLQMDRADWRLRHGDLHHFNVLHGPRGWLAIDPKGLVGPPAVEFAPILCNPLPMTLVTDPGRMAARAAQVVAHAGIDRSELADWTLVHVAACAAWSRGDDRPWWLAVLRAAAGLAGAA